MSYEPEAVATLTDEAQSEPPIQPAAVPGWKFRATCCVCGQPIEEGRETPRGLIPMGHPYPKPNGTIGLQCERCFQKHEAHKAE